LKLHLETYAEPARQAVAAAQSLADDRRHPEVLPLHLFYALLDRDLLVQNAIAKAGVDPTDALLEAEALLRKLPRSANGPSYLASSLLDLLGRAEGEAAREGGVPIGSRHLALAASQEARGEVSLVMRACGLRAPLLRAALADEAAQPSPPRVAPSKDATMAPKQAEAASGGADPLVEYGSDLTAVAAAGGFDPTVGRDAEMRRMLQVLARRLESNPLLVGEPGIGKTSIVRGLATRMAHGDVPRMLLGKRIVSLDAGAMLAGAKLRGQLEERMRSVISAVKASGGEVLLLIPDLGALVGGAGGGGDLLAAALGRDELRAIAICTPEALRTLSEDHRTLMRRFVPIPIEAPSIDETIAVLRGLVGRFEIAHGVRIADPSLVAAAQFARRYVPGVQLPKSAVDLVDEAAARVRVEMESVPTELDRMARRIEALEIQLRSLEDEVDAESVSSREKIVAEMKALEPRILEMRAAWEKELAHAGELRQLKKALDEAQQELESARTSESHARAGELRFGTIPLLEKQVTEAEKAMGGAKDLLVRDTVQPEDVAEVVGTWTGVPVARMLEEETQKLLRMEENLRRRVIGQDHAVTALSKAVRRGRVGLRDPKRPIGSFLFLGPTGVGKTELAKALAELLFDDEAALTRLDMSEFMEKHMVARLLGAPPGYVDSESGGFLTEAVRQRPYSVILFDEMEKAHPDVFNILLQVLDDGRLTDSRGRPAHFQDTVIIMTSNVGSHRILDHQGSNEALRDKVEEELHKAFRPEFLNRVDDVIIFNPLSQEDLRGITEIQLRGLERLLAHRRVKLTVDDAAKDRLAELGYEPAFGARPLKRVILRELQDPMAAALLEGGYGPGETIAVGVDDAGFTFRKG
jgi:ATP-dependent Clp protease ATP-binding subunit ClpB